MNPQIDKIVEKEGVLTFSLSGVNVSLANAIRRTVLSDIPTVVFKTSPNEDNNSKILVNTTRFNNEIIKQRLSCIPIHIDDIEIPLKNYLLEVNMENTSDTIMYITTEHFKIKNMLTNEYLSSKDTHNIFPPNDMGYYIDFVRLRPQISENIPGEKLQMTCEFSIDNAKTDGMFNVVSCCSYGFTVDDVYMERELDKKKKEWKDKGLSKDDIEFESDNWKLLEGKRIVKKDCFDFTIQTIGVFSNRDLIKQACKIIMTRLDNLKTIIETDAIKISESENTMKHSYDVILENEDYTIGKIIEYMLYTKFFEEAKTMTFCGFKKMHPHDIDSVIRVAYKEPADMAMVKQNLLISISLATNVYETILGKF
jgi:DNA-directed RNA polymerase subunit L